MKWIGSTSAVVLSIACLASACLAGPQPVLPVQASTVDLSQPLTLERAIQIGLANQSSVAIANSQYSASRARITEANQSYYPQITPTYQYSNQQPATTSSFGGFTGTSTPEQRAGGITTKQLILDSGQREENAAISRSSARASEYNFLDTRQAAILTITSDYYALLRSKDLARVAQSSVNRAETTLKATQAFAEAGTIAKKDVLQAQSDYDNSQVQLIQAQNAVRLAETSLKNAMGILTTQSITTSDMPLQPPAAEADKRTVADYMNIALDNRPDLKRELNLIDANRHSEHVAAINSSVQVQSTFSDNYRVIPDSQDNRLLDLSVSYPLFDAGASRARVREAKENVYQAKEQLLQTKENVQFSVEQSYYQREEARLRGRATQTALTAAQANYDAAQAAQKEGVNTIVDVITAQTSLVTAETNAVQAVYDFYTADAALNRAIGSNDPYAGGGR